MAKRFIVSKDPDKKRYSGGSDQRVFKTKGATKERVKKYHISEIDW